MTTKEQFRKVKVPIYEGVPGGSLMNGYFHEWAIDPYLLDNGSAFGRTKAIVELEDGTIKLFDPISIKFVESF